MFITAQRWGLFNIGETILIKSINNVSYSKLLN